MTVDDAGDDDSGHRDTIRNLPEDWSSVAKRRRNSLVSDVGVYHNTAQEVEGRVADLKSGEGFREVVWVLHLGNEGEEGGMT